MQKNWEVVFTQAAQGWFDGLAPRDQAQVTRALDQLREHGPQLKRPLADRIEGSRHHKMKELRPPAGNLRALFAFDPRQRAVILVGGDKTNDWKGWYRRNIKTADRLFDQHLQTMKGGDRWQLKRTGARSEPRVR